jgi:hypothetical protein
LATKSVFRFFPFPIISAKEAARWQTKSNLGKKQGSRNALEKHALLWLSL